MPIKPLLEWEQTETEVIANVTVKGFKKEAVDVFISDLWVKINAAPTYLLHLDLLHPIDVKASSFYCEMPNIRLTLKKVLPLEKKQQTGPVVVVDDEDDEADEETKKKKKQEETIWDTLIIDTKALGRDQVIQRRQSALSRAEQLYNMKLNTRENIKAAEKKRYFQEQWELEKEQRNEIERKMRAEKEEEQTKLEEWRKGELAQQQEESGKSGKFANPGDIFLAAQQKHKEQQQEKKSGDVPAIRKNPGEVKVSFTKKFGGDGMPARARGDEDVYRKSRYKPVSIEDSPMFWKARGDEHYKARRWHDAADAYSESIKRDGVFLTCTMNRAACFLRLHEYKRCINDCDLAITMLSNTPASDTTQEKYRRTLVKLHSRRGAAKAWAGDLTGALNDYKMAVAYKHGSSEDECAALERDCDAIEQYMKSNGLKEERDPLDDVRGSATRAYYGGKYAEAADLYRQLLAKNEYDIKARNNLTATLLQMGALREALGEAQTVIGQCQEVAEALSEPGAQTTTAVDSDDEEGDAADDDTGLRRRNAAAKMIREHSGAVYLLLKAYTRAAAACTGLKDYKSALEFFEGAIRISPYDNDLRDDANRVLEKARMAAIVDSTTAAQKK